MNIMPSLWGPPRSRTNKGGRHKAGNDGKRIDGDRDWLNGGVRLFHRKTWDEREVERVMWIAGKFTIFCCVCGQKKTSDHFDEEQIYVTFPWCLQCQQEDADDSLAE